MSFVKHDFKVFGWYRIILGITVLAYFMLAEVNREKVCGQTSFWKRTVEKLSFSGSLSLKTTLSSEY